MYSFFIDLFLMMRYWNSKYMTLFFKKLIFPSFNFKPAGFLSLKKIKDVSTGSETTDSEIEIFFSDILFIPEEDF